MEKNCDLNSYGLESFKFKVSVVTIDSFDEVITVERCSTDREVFAATAGKLSNIVDVSVLTSPESFLSLTTKVGESVNLIEFTDDDCEVTVSISIGANSATLDFTFVDKGSIEDGTIDDAKETEGKGGGGGVG